MFDFYFLLAAPFFFDLFVLHAIGLFHFWFMSQSKATSGVHHLLNYNGYENEMLRIELITFVALLGIVGYGFVFSTTIDCYGAVGFRLWRSYGYHFLEREAMYV